MAALVVGAVATITLVCGGIGCELADVGMESETGGYVVLDTPFGKMRITVAVTAEGGNQ